MTDVLVVGAGPVGLTLASELARFGVRVRIIDRAAHPTGLSKALVLWGRTLELMDRAGSAAPCVAAGIAADSVCFKSGSQGLGSARFDLSASAFNYALVIPQRDTERILTENLASFGVTVERQVDLIDLRFDCHGAVASLQGPGRTMETVETPWIIACDGAHSTVRQKSGIQFRGETRLEDWSLADIRLQGANLPRRDRIATYFHPSGTCAIFPMPDDRFRVIVYRGPSGPSPSRDAPSSHDMQMLIEQRTGAGWIVRDASWLATFRIDERIASAFRVDCIFLAGDAAHIHSPAGGQGMNMGMQDAFNLAWKLALVTRGAANRSLLDTYGIERRKVAARTLRNTSLLTDCGTLAHPAAQRVRDVALRFFLGRKRIQRHIASTLSGMNGIARSPLSVGRFAGSRLSPESYAGSPPGHGPSAKFILYAANCASGRMLCGRYSCLLEARIRTPVKPGHLYIVRPDGYVGFTASRQDWAAAEGYLHGLTA